MKYKVLVQETRYLEVEVAGKSEADALENAQWMYAGGEIDLGAHSGATVICRGTCGGCERKLGSWNAD